MDADGVFFTATDGAQSQNLLIVGGDDHPVTLTNTNQRTDRVFWLAHHRHLHPVAQERSIRILRVWILLRNYATGKLFTETDEALR